MNLFAEKPSYLLSSEQTRARAGSSRTSHPDYFVADPETEYQFVCLPAHLDSPKDEQGGLVPFAVVERYMSQYRTPDGDIRRYPVADPALREAGLDPLYKRSVQLQDSEDDDQRKLGWNVRPQPRILINIIVIASKDGKSGTTKVKMELGDLYTKPHMFEMAAKTYHEKFEPLFSPKAFQQTGFYDLFGEVAAACRRRRAAIKAANAAGKIPADKVAKYEKEYNELGQKLQQCHEVPVLWMKKHKKGDKVFQVEWAFDRLDGMFITATPKHPNYDQSYAAVWNSVIDIRKHETNRPHTVEDLEKIWTLSTIKGIGKSAADVEDNESIAWRGGGAATVPEDSDFAPLDTSVVPEQPERAAPFEDEPLILPKASPVPVPPAPAAKAAQSAKKTKTAPKPAAAPAPTTIQDDDDAVGLDFSKEDASFGGGDTSDSEDAQFI